MSIEREPVHVETLRRRFGHLENLEVELVDLHRSALPDELADSFDTVILFDVLQRAAEPKELLDRAAQAVVSGGSILIHVPADHALYGPTDRAAGHLRRFSQEDLGDLVRSAGLELVWCRPFNRLGRIAWRAHHAAGAGRITTVKARGFDALVPLARRLDATGAGEGLSWVAVARVP